MPTGQQLSASPQLIGSPGAEALLLAHRGDDRGSGLAVTFPERFEGSAAEREKSSGQAGGRWGRQR